MNKSFKNSKQFLVDNSVVLLFLVICSAGIILAAKPAAFISSEVCTRLFRNLTLILSLLVPVWTGIGLNFSIVLGAMAAQAGLIFIINFNIMGIFGLAVAFTVSIPLAVLLGVMTGKLFNRSKGQEMITGMILGFFAKGVYELIFMYMCGPVIPMKNKEFMLPSGVGINGIITLDDSLNCAIDNIWKVTLDKVLWVLLGIFFLLWLIDFVRKYQRHRSTDPKQYLRVVMIAVLTVIYAVALTLYPRFKTMLLFTRVPVITGLIIFIVCMFTVFLEKTKLGSDIKAVGQSLPIAKASGINVDRIRIIAVVISTIIAALGQLIYLQNLGTFTTYSAHEQIGTFSIAALLIGGASIKRAGIGHAIMGALLFHIMFIVAPLAGKNLFNDAMIGEYFRVFASYAVIAMALALHAWKSFVKAKQKKVM